MAEAITTNSYRRKLARVMAGDGALAPITHMAFGDGGHDPSTLTAVAPDPEQTALRHELLRKPLSLVIQEDEFSVTGRGIIERDELAGYAVSEAALIDADGVIVGLKNYAPKFKESDEQYETDVKLRF